MIQTRNACFYTSIVFISLSTFGRVVSYLFYESQKPPPPQPPHHSYDSNTKCMFLYIYSIYIFEHIWKSSELFILRKSKEQTTPHLHVSKVAL